MKNSSLKTQKRKMTRKIKILISVILLGGILYLVYILYLYWPIMKMDCILGKETHKKGITCKILEIKDRGNQIKNILTTDEFIGNLTTTEKFIEVKVKLKIEKEQPKDVARILSEHILIDNQNQQYKELFASDRRPQATLSSSKEFEYSVFFELPKNWNINNFKKLKLIFIQAPFRAIP